MFSDETEVTENLAFSPPGSSKKFRQKEDCFT